MAHIGVLRALEERGIPVDFVGGASIGAILGGAHAMGMDSKRLTLLCQDSFQKNNPFRDYTIPVISLLRSRKIERLARAAYGEARIEDLWLSFFCVSTNLCTCDVKVCADGPLWLAARTSSALPGIMLPVLHEGAVHVDGGVMNNLPGDIMRRRAGIVITVDVDSRENMNPGYAEFPSPWKILWSKVLPWKKPDPSPTVAEIMMATIMTGCRKSADAVKEDADLSLEPPVSGIGILDFKNLEETARAGYEYTQGMIEQLPDDSPLRRLMNSLAIHIHLLPSWSMRAHQGLKSLTCRSRAHRSTRRFRHACPSPMSVSTIFSTMREQGCVLLRLRRRLHRNHRWGRRSTQRSQRRDSERSQDATGSNGIAADEVGYLIRGAIRDEDLPKAF